MLATAGYRFYHYRQAQAAQAAGAAFQEALRLDPTASPTRRRPRSPSCRRTRRSGYALLGRFVDAALTLKKDPKAGRRRL